MKEHVLCLYIQVLWLSISGGVGHGVAAASSLTEKGRGRGGGGPSMRGVTAFLQNKVWRGAGSGAVMLVCSAATQVLEERAGKELPRQGRGPYEQSRRREETEDRASEGIRGKSREDVVAARLVPRVKSCSQSEMSSENAPCPSWEEN